MGDNFCFLFYPGDYLRDTQCLSAGAQVAYDRIICEHMRHTCISEHKLKFFTKRLDAEELEGLLDVLEKIPGGYCIDWVVNSISKRQAYSKSRAENRFGKTKEHMLTHEKDMKKISEHMEKEKEKEKENIHIRLNITFDEFWTLYDKKVGDKEKLAKKWAILTDEEREKAMWHITQYKASQPDKKFRKDPGTYLNNKSFNDEIIQNAATKPGGAGTGKAFNGRNGGFQIALDSLKQGIRDVTARGTAGTGSEI